MTADLSSPISSAISGAKQLNRISRQKARAAGTQWATVKPRACTAIACKVTWGGGGSGTDPIGDFLGKVASRVSGFLLSHSLANPEQVQRSLLPIIVGVKSELFQRAMSCAQGATEGWQETRALGGQPGGKAAQAGTQLLFARYGLWLESQVVLSAIRAT